MYLEAIYRDPLMLLPSYPLYYIYGKSVLLPLWKSSSAISSRTKIVVSPLNAFDLIDAKKNNNKALLLEKRIAFSK